MIDRRQFVLGSAGAWVAWSLTGCAPRPLLQAPDWAASAGSVRPLSASFDAELIGTRLRLVYPAPANGDARLQATLRKATTIVAIDSRSQRPHCFGHASSGSALAFVDAGKADLNRQVAELDLAAVSLSAGTYFVHAAYMQYVTPIRVLVL